MASKSATKAQASRATVIAQVVTLVLLAGVVGAVTLWPSSTSGAVEEASFARAEEQAEIRYRSYVEEQNGKDDGEARQANLSVAASMLGIAGRVTPPAEQQSTETEATTAPEETVEVVETQSPQRGEAIAKLIGEVRAGDRVFGVFSVGAQQGIVPVGGKQRFLPRGVRSESDQIELEVVSVGDGEAVILENGVEFRIEKIARSVSSASVTSNAAPAATPAADARRVRSDLKRPSIRDFQKPDGSYDRAAYAQALRDYNRERAEMQRQGGPAGNDGVGANTARIIDGNGRDEKLSTE